MPYVEIFFIIANTVINSIGMIANGLVIYLSLFKTPPSMKTYSVLILNAGLCGFVACATAFLVQQRLIPTGMSLLHIPYGPCKLLNGNFCSTLHAITIHCYTYANSILLLCFIYRFLVLKDFQITRKQLSFTLCLFYLFSLSQMILLILSYDDPIILSEIFMLKFPDYQFDPLFVSGNANILEWKIFYVVLSMCLSIFPYYIIICYCRSQTLKILESRWNELTEKTRRIHLTLLHALTFQATLPAVFTFAVAVFALGALNIYNHPILEYSTFALVSLIPSLAPLGTLHFIRPYREWLEGTVLRWRAKVTNSAEPSVPSVVAEVLENKN